MLAAARRDDAAVLRARLAVVAVGVGAAGMAVARHPHAAERRADDARASLAMARVGNLDARPVAAIASHASAHATAPSHLRALRALHAAASSPPVLRTVITLPPSRAGASLQDRFSPYNPCAATRGALR